MTPARSGTVHLVLLAASLGFFLLTVALFAFAARGEREAKPPADTRAIYERGRRLVPLHATKERPGPSDWLANHPEPGQTFAEYARGRPPRPSKKRTTLYVVPVGAFDAAQRDLLDDTVDYMGRFFELPVKSLDPVGLDAIPKASRRTHMGNEQILTRYVLELLRRRAPEDAVATIALTASDLWPGAGWNFVFGEASLTDRVGVWSVARFGDPSGDRRPLVLARTCKTASHETGHMLGLAHCTAYECVMNGSNHLAETDGRPMALCPECAPKVWWACNIADPAKRYDALAEFAERHELDEPAKLWKKSAAALRE